MNRFLILCGSLFCFAYNSNCSDEGDAVDAFVGFVSDLVDKHHFETPGTVEEFSLEKCRFSWKLSCSMLDSRKEQLAQALAERQRTTGVEEDFDRIHVTARFKLTELAQKVTVDIKHLNKKITALNQVMAAFESEADRVAVTELREEFAQLKELSVALRADVNKARGCPPDDTGSLFGD